MRRSTSTLVGGVVGVPPPGGTGSSVSPPSVGGGGVTGVLVSGLTVASQSARGTACQTTKVETGWPTGRPPPTTTSDAPEGAQHQGPMSPRWGTKELPPAIKRFDHPELSLVFSRVYSV